MYNNLTEFGIAMKLVRILKLCVNETYGRIRVGKNLSENFPIRNGLKKSVGTTWVVSKLKSPIHVVT